MQISFVSCVNDFDVYKACVTASVLNQHEKVATELIPISNTSSSYPLAATALNRGLNDAKGNIVVFCHQDVIFPSCWLTKLVDQISIVERKYKNWGVLGTYGVALNGSYVGHVVDPRGHRRQGSLPRIVQSLDEHCLIIRKDSGLHFDEGLGGFHFYGADLCLQAMVKGVPNFAIDACVKHLSRGKVDDSFYCLAEKLCDKWRHKKCPLAVIQTTCGVFRVKYGFKGKLAYTFSEGRRKFRKLCKRKFRKLLGRFSRDKL